MLPKTIGVKIGLCDDVRCMAAFPPRTDIRRHTARATHGEPPEWRPAGFNYVSSMASSSLELRHRLSSRRSTFVEQCDLCEIMRNGHLTKSTLCQSYLPNP